VGAKATVLVLGGGPDREREVSLRSAGRVAAALREAGYDVLEGDIDPDHLDALNQRFDVVFPMLHGRFGEGGALQRILDGRNLRYVGSGARASWLAMDKAATKDAAAKVGIPTPDYQHLGPMTPLVLEPPLVIKPLTEGSSFGVDICRDAEAVAEARKRLHAHFAFGMAERFIDGREMTVGILDGEPLPIIEIRPSVEFYDYEAKYNRDDTHYAFEIDLPVAALDQMRQWAKAVFEKVGCRDLGRVDFIVDRTDRPWFLELNTIPGFTDHSLVPMAAAKAGLAMPALCDRLVRLALDRDVDRYPKQERSERRGREGRRASRPKR